jgi:YegS/Rv2252/BmrU family lipid kinase
VKIQFIINASSGDGKGKNLLPLLQKKSGDLGLPAEFALSFHPQEAREIAFDGQRRGAELIVACGGDGTIHSILPALVHQPAALGIIPTGTANDLARNWNIPLNFDRALKVIAQGRPKSVDVIQVPGRGYIAGAAGIGFDAAVVEQAARLRRIYRGLLPFSIAFLSEFSRHTPAAVSLRAGDWRYQGPAWQILITKITRYAYILKITSPVSPDNGLMEICLIPQPPKLGLLKTLPKLPFLGLRKLPGAILCTASQLEIESSPPMMIQGDGDLIGQTPAVFQVVPRALQIMTPAPRRRIRGLKSI